MVKPSAVHFSEIDSTNSFLKLRIKEGDFRYNVVSAAVQTRGRGRGENSWISLSGNIHFSVAIQIADSSLAKYMGPWCSYCTSRLLEETFNFQPELKWPNDLLFNGKKLGGFLLEFVTTPQNTEFIICGVGINANITPTQVKDFSFAPVSIKEISDKPVETENIILNLSSEILKFTPTPKVLEIIHHFAVNNTSTLGKFVSVKLPGNKIISGTAIKITDTFSLIVDTGKEFVEITGGDLNHSSGR
ncbi:MAG: biotin--[acetyl-CoA-carboxylase] ligase [Deltaproteobacteria bacterium]|nr:biotin--[acetyl-CoA-carboxylase] ligase [Deltaproteobacteria bacterium]